MNEMTVFDPALQSEPENDFLLQYLGAVPVIARRAIPSGMVAAAVMPIIERVDELQKIKEHDGVDWVGVDRLKEAIRQWQTQNRKWELDNQRNKKAPRWPSLYSYDGKGRAHRSGPGADVGRIRTYFGPAGERIPFEIELIPENVAPWVAPGFTEQMSTTGLYIDPTANRIECRVKTPDGICGHTESYKSESRASYSAARARMSKHLRKSTIEAEAHRSLHTEEFGE